VPGWKEGPQAQRFVDGLEASEKIEVYQRIASVLPDPAVDGRSNFDLNFFPFAGLNVRRYHDSAFVFDYRVEPDEACTCFQSFEPAMCCLLRTRNGSA
jgi:hypothetical protein